MHRRFRAILGVALLSASLPVQAGTTPPGFIETAYSTGIFNLDGFDWAPNGDMWIIRKHGVIEVLRAGAATRTYVRTLAVDSSGERGLVGLAVDPGFNTNQYIYFFHTVPGTPSHNRVSRFRSVGDDLQDEVILLEGPPLDSVDHNSGNLRIGEDGYLYISMGDNRQPAMAQDRSSLLGKILRIATDGSIPPSNPFVGDPNARPEVWAYGFRNPYRFTIQPGTGTVFIGDVGESTWEELDLGIAGANYGHPLVEGPEPAGVAGMTYPVFSYPHDGTGAAIILGDHMTPGTFPPEYEGDLFYADFSRGIIYRLLLDEANQVIGNQEFVTGVPFPVHVRVGPDGALYYASINFQTIYRTAWVGGTNRQPVAVAAATPNNGLAPLGVQLDGSGSSDPDNDPLTFQWAFGDGGSSTAPSPFHTYVNAGVYNTTLTVDDTSLNAGTTVRIVAGNRAPAGTIAAPVNASNYNAGDTIFFSGSATDPEEGTLPPAGFSWTVAFHHNTHIHPYLGPLSGITSGSFTIGDIGETSTDVYFEIRMSATDSGVPLGAAGALSDMEVVNIYPNLGTFTLATTPRADLGLRLDGAPVTPPVVRQGVVGLKRSIEALSPQTPGDGHTYTFDSWSDMGARIHTIVTPSAPATFTARFNCNLIEEVTGLELTHGPGAGVTLTWTPPTGLCLASGPAVYRIYASPTASPVSPPGQFPLDPAFSLVAETSSTSAGLGPAPGDQFYIVVGLGSDGAEGPAGVYGR